MRTFRFRAFDKEEKVMIYGIENIYDGGYFVNSNNQEISIYSTSLSSSSFGNNLNNEDIEIMQFTGLFDKNGTPIYEGDIVKYVSGKNYQTTGVVTWADDKNSFNLKTYPLMCAFVIHNEKENKTDKFEWDETDYMEVIGNIYEHPNLLESEEK